MKIKVSFLIVPVVCMEIMSCSCGDFKHKMESTLLPVRSEFVSPDVLEMNDLIDPYKVRLDAEMNVVLGAALQTMDAGRPESLLSNFVCDILLRKANSITHTDIAITNVGGLRKPIPEGVVTLRTVYEVMPFDNRVVLLELQGNELLRLCDAIASVSGEGVSGITFGISGGKAFDVKVNGEPIDIARFYTIVTSDYLSFGNDKLVPLSHYRKMTATNLQLRELLIDAICAETKNGKEISSQLDGRIYEK